MKTNLNCIRFCIYVNRWHRRWNEPAGRRENEKMKDFFEDLGKRLGETAETMTNRAGDAIEIQRLKSQVRGLARGNAVDLMELGKLIYDRYKAGEEMEEDFKGLCEAVKSREESIREYDRKIAKIKGARECKNCGKMVAKDMSFCPYCGEKAVIDQDEFVGEENYADMMKERAADVADDVAQKADEAAKKASEMAHKAARKTADMADKAAEKVEKTAEKAAEKVNGAAEKMKADSDSGKE